MLDGVDSGVFDASAASRTFDALGQAFTDELANPPAWVGTDLGADDHVAKPINPHELLARTERVFR
jgi:CheY-like chemotaxis protein